MSARGYVTDVPYLRIFIAELAPSWLDHAAILSGFRPPSRHGAFTYCDLGCGQGITTTAFAATHPDGQFVGIDLMPEHVEHAQRFGAEAAVSNAAFFEADFARAAELDLPKFDYIVSHGVYSWVDPTVQRELRAFVDRFLKPGGLFYVSYNSMPGRGPDVALQYLLRTLGNAFPGDSIARVTSAIPIVQSVVRLKAPALVGSIADADLEASRDHLPIAYLAHEFMNERWKPLFVTEVRADMAMIGLRPAGSATLIDNHDSFMLGRAAREILARIDDDDLRELVRDYFIDQSFRRDVFIRDGGELDDDERRSRLMDSTFALARPPGKIEYSTTTPAGKLDFDNPFARAIVAALVAGPRRLADIARDGDDRARYLANAMVLCAARILRPVEARPVSVKALNRVIGQRLDGPEELGLLACAHGTGFAVDTKLLRFLRDGGALDGALADQHEFLVAQGIE